MPAFTVLPSGEIVRWHAAPGFSECTNAKCNLYHVSRDELFPPEAPFVPADVSP